MKKDMELPDKSGFKDRTAIKEKKDGDYPWEFKAPHYDKRSSCYMKAGDSYGVGHRQPVGHHGNPKERADVLPYGRPQTMELYDER